MLEPVNPVNGKVGEEKEDERAGDEPWPPVVVHPVIEHGVPSDLPKKPRDHHQVDPRRSHHARFDFQPDLVFEEPRVMLKSAIEEDEVGNRANDEVEDEGGDERDRPDGDGLTHHRVAGEEGCGLD